MTATYIPRLYEDTLAIRAKHYQLAYDSRYGRGLARDALSPAEHHKELLDQFSEFLRKVCTPNDLPNGQRLLGDLLDSHSAAAEGEDEGQSIATKEHTGGERAEEKLAEAKDQFRGFLHRRGMSGDVIEEACRMVDAAMKGGKDSIPANATRGGFGG